MFIIETEPTFTHEVKVLVPVDGGYRQDTFKARYRVMPTEDADKYDLFKEDQSKAFLRAVVIGLEDIVDDQRKPVPYSDTLRDRLLGWPHTRRALAATYFEAIKGTARQGN